MKQSILESLSGVLAASGAGGLIAQMAGGSLHPAAQVTLAGGLVMATLLAIYTIHVARTDDDES